MPSKGLRNEGDGGDEEKKGRDGGDQVECSPRGRDVGKYGKKDGANGEEVEGGGADGTAFSRTDWFGGEEEGA